MSVLRFRGHGKELAAALDRLSGLVSKRTTLPILSCVQLQVKEGQVTAAATNLDQYARIALPVEIADGEEGAGACVNLGLFATLAKRSNGDGAEVAIGDGKLTVRAGGRKAEVATLPLGEFSAEPRLDNSDEAIVIDGPRMAAAIRSIWANVSDEETRYILNGIYFAEDGTAVATDGRRLAANVYAEEGQGLPNAILPTPVLRPLVDFIDSAGEGGEVRAVVTEGGVAFIAEGEFLASQRIEGNYPNYKQVIPDYANGIGGIDISVPRERMVGALEWVAPFVHEKQDSVTLSCSGGQMRISVNRPDNGGAEEELDLAAPVAADIRVGLSRRFLADFLRYDGGELFRARVAAKAPEASPVVILADDPGYLGILMPVRTT